MCRADAADVMATAELAPDRSGTAGLTDAVVPERAVVVPCFLGAALTNSMAKAASIVGFRDVVLRRANGNPNSVFRLLARGLAVSRLAGAHAADVRPLARFYSQAGRPRVACLIMFAARLAEAMEDDSVDWRAVKP